MEAKELIVDDGAERERIEAVIDGIVQTEAVLLLALFLEGEVVCEVSALVIAAKEI